MSVWVCFPSKRPVAEVNARLAKWHELGYFTAVMRDFGDFNRSDQLAANFTTAVTKYPGYALAQNGLVHTIAEYDKAAAWFVCAADDVDPEPSMNASHIAAECYQMNGTTFAVMQPTGDRWGDRQGAYIDRVAGSPWIGREFALRTYQGKGPYWPEYTHMGVDEELQAVAKKLGVFWQRPDLTHYHDHWGRPRAGEAMGRRDRMPAFLEHANSPAEWRRYKELFAARQAAGFPGSELLA